MMKKRTTYYYHHRKNLMCLTQNVFPKRFIKSLPSSVCSSSSQSDLFESDSIDALLIIKQLQFKIKMGSILSSIKEDTQNAVLRSKLIDIKMNKTKRDSELAFKMATTRERCHWLILFYLTMIVFNFARLRIVKEKSFSPLPLAWLPYISVPYLFLYQLDFAYGNKLERLSLESKNIIINEQQHFFNQPMRLPKSFESEYRKMMSEAREKFPEDKLAQREWAVFVDEISNEEIYEQVLPATKVVNEKIRVL